MPLTLVFMGTPDFSVPTLRALSEAGHRIAAVYSQPPRPAGRRGLNAVPSPVAGEAERLGIPVRTPVSLKGEAEQAAFAALGADVAVVVAYGLLLPPDILAAPRLGALNGHGSLLPRWRGAAPIQRAIEAGDAVTGMMVMRMEAGLDTGPVALTCELGIGPSETAGELHDRLSLASAELMVEALAQLEAGTLAFEPQDAIAARTGRELAYARKIEKGEAAVDWTRTAGEIARRINAFSPFPGGWTSLAGERLKLLRAVAEPGDGEPGTALDGSLLVAAGEGAVRLLSVQKAGGRPAEAAEFLRGTSVPAGTRLG
ncbi:methionyl-tRNA formyltransferase [Aureimonas pseudogalii]|uniref:Methionyl-tRNA formyltransferase n=1 Tax=Aureimonas pseudogalii TaxID=1744844 RepID=A0A7W6E850_9HYPH|nr:methionyl-tRNA formyltransferase [Aureimonas pseudogalii]MBB3996473.1 methionyl-tRNA formyltransferase [Aureimonas pseudogalii]